MQPVPADAQMFKFPQGLASFMLVASAFFAALLAGAVVVLRGADRVLLLVLLPCGVVIASIAVLSVRSFGMLRDSVAVNGDGIWYLPRRGEPRFLAWNDVARVRADDVQQRLVLMDTTGMRTIRLEYQLENFGQLRTFVLQHTAPATHLDPSAREIFHRTWINKGILAAGVLVVLALASLSIRDVGICSLFVAFAVVLMIGIVSDPTRVVLSDDALLIEYPGWHRAIAWKTITGIALGDMNQRGNVWAAVVIERQQRKPIRLFRFSEGSVALHDALVSGWRSGAGTRASSAGSADESR